MCSVYVRTSVSHVMFGSGSVRISVCTCMHVCMYVYMCAGVGVWKSTCNDRLNLFDGPCQLDRAGTIDQTNKPTSSTSRLLGD